MAEHPSPLVSVVTVTRNAGAVVRRCIDSVNGQQYRDIEHIVIDGASSDGSQQLVERSATEPHSRLKYFVSEPDCGIYDAMNKGLARATGQYVYFLNSDDRFFDRDSVAAVVCVLQQTRVALLQTRVIVVDPNTGAGSLFAPPRGLLRTSPLFRGVYQQAIWAERSLFDVHGGFDVSYEYCGDVEWLMRVLRSEPRCASSEVLSTVFLLGGASSRFDRVKVEQRRAEMQHYSRVEWTACKVARRLARPLEALARRLQS